MLYKAIYMIYLFTKVKMYNPDILDNTNDYIFDLKKAIELYTHFIGLKDIGSIYIKYIKSLVDDLNEIFTQPIIINRCCPTQEGYGCGRITDITLIEGKTDDKSRSIILIGSSIPDKADTAAECTNFKVVASDITIKGGGLKYRQKKTKRKSKSKKNKKRLSKKL